VRVSVVQPPEWRRRKPVLLPAQALGVRALAHAARSSARLTPPRWRSACDVQHAVLRGLGPLRRRLGSQQRIGAQRIGRVEPVCRRRHPAGPWPSGRRVLGALNPDPAVARFRPRAKACHGRGVWPRPRSPLVCERAAARLARVRATAGSRFSACRQAPQRRCPTRWHRDRSTAPCAHRGWQWPAGAPRPGWCRASGPGAQLRRVDVDHRR